MAKKPTRLKSEVQTIALQTHDEVALAIKQIGDLQRELTRLSTLQDDEKAVIDEKYTAQLTEIKEKIKPLQQAVQAYCECHRDELTNGGKQKTGYFNTGEVQWRVKPPAVVIKGVDSVLESLKNFGLFRFIRTKDEINKEAILNEPDGVKGVAGITIKTGVEEFVIKPNEQEIRDI